MQFWSNSVTKNITASHMLLHITTLWVLSPSPSSWTAVTCCHLSQLTSCAPNSGCRLSNRMVCSKHRATNYTIGLCPECLLHFWKQEATGRLIHTSQHEEVHRMSDKTELKVKELEMVIQASLKSDTKMKLCIENLIVTGRLSNDAS